MPPLDSATSSSNQTCNRNSRCQPCTPHTAAGYRTAATSCSTTSQEPITPIHSFTTLHSNKQMYETLYPAGLGQQPAYSS